MTDCLSPFYFGGNQFVFNECYPSITMDVSDANLFSYHSLMSLSEACFEAYKYRLNEYGSQFVKSGTREYDIANEAIIKLVLPFNPLKFSFSISPDPSLHFVVRFPQQISLFIETYLDLEDGHDTYVQIKKKSDILTSLNVSFDESIEIIRTILLVEIRKESDLLYLPSELV